MSKIINGVASEYDMPFEKNYDVKYDEKGIETFTRYQDPTIKQLTSLLEKIKEIINNDKITGIEAKLLIKDLLESEVN